MMLLLASFLCAHVISTDCSESLSLPDGTVVFIPQTSNYAFALPQCEDVGLVALGELACYNGEWYSSYTQGLANGSPFCVHEDDPLIQQTQQEIIEQVQRDFPAAAEENPSLQYLKAFWDITKQTHESISGCPRGATECVKFDEFEDQYVAGQFDDELTEFLGLPLEEPNYLEYDQHIDLDVREFKFGSGLQALVLELDNDAGVYATITSDVSQGLQLMLNKCTPEEECQYMLSSVLPEKFNQGRAHSILDEEIEKLEQDPSRRLLELEEKATRQAQTGHNDEMIKERFLKAQQRGPKNRRRLNLMFFNVPPKAISFTFMYDPKETTYMEAQAWSATAIRRFNQLVLDSFGPLVPEAFRYAEGFNFELYRKNVIRAESWSFKGVESGKCGEEPPIKHACIDQFNKLSASARADKVHCFVTDKLHNDWDWFPGVHVTGCGGTSSGLSWGVTEDVAWNQDVVLHEMGHQMKAKHDDSTCQGTNCFTVFGHRICTGFSCSLMSPDDTIQSLWFSSANMAKIKQHFRDVAN